MIFDIDKPEKQRFSFFTSTLNADTGKITYNDPVGDAWVELRSSQPFYEERLAKRKKVVERVYNPKSRGMDRDEYYPDMTIPEIKQERDEGWDYAITDFGGFKDASKQIIEVTRPNKLKMMANPVFERFYSRCMEIMQNSGITEEEEKVKNSSALPSGGLELEGKAAKTAKEHTQKPAK